jgi:hypothetical protein
MVKDNINEQVLVVNFNYLECDISHNYDKEVTIKLHKFKLMWYK